MPIRGMKSAARYSCKCGFYTEDYWGYKEHRCKIEEKLKESKVDASLRHYKESPQRGV